MKISKESQIYIKIFFFALFAIFINWSFWDSPWGFGTFYRLIMIYLTLIIVVIYRVIKFFRKQENNKAGNVEKDKN